MSGEPFQSDQSVRKEVLRLNLKQDAVSGTAAASVWRQCPIEKDVFLFLE